ncbi:MAG: 1,2-phenylacetyl-CoA epoxidase subunit PaaE [Chitinophagaceae bacterium]
MSIHFHSLTVRSIQKATEDCVVVTFDIPENLQKEFAFRQGQSLTMRTTLNNEEVRRTYSLCSSPLDHEWKVAIKKVDGGLFSSFANGQLTAGDALEVMQPVGKFYVDLDPTHQKNYLALAAGSGITPVLSIIKTTLLTEPKSNFTLIYGNRSRSSIIFFEELEGLKNQFLDRFQLVHLLSRERTEIDLNNGKINAAKLDELATLINYNSVDEFFICGPEEMIFSIQDYFTGKGIDKKKIHFELFTTPGQPTYSGKEKLSPQKLQEENSGPQANITIQLDGRSFSFNQSLQSKRSILDAAMQEGADLPFACKGGVCCTCKAKLLEGKVDMDVHWGLEDDEVQQGYILTCQSHPTSEKLVIDFDIK